jgi:hypothetical protein
MSKQRPVFTITNVSPSTEEGYVNVSVSYENGALMLPFRSTLPDTAILAQVRAEVRRRLTNEASTLERLLHALRGEHEL